MAQDYKTNYIEQYEWLAVTEMHRSGVPASITMAQAVLESNWGRSRLAVKGNNHFGIKCHGKWDKKIYEDDDKKNECFRKYSLVIESFRDHSDFLSMRGRYESLFNLRPDDYKSWAKGLKKAGYATNPQYPKLLIRLIEENEFFRLDKISREEMASTLPGDHPNLPRIYIKKYTVNKRLCVDLTEGIDMVRLAKELELKCKTLYKYNDLTPAKRLVAGDRIFIQPKRTSAKTSYHRVEEGETLWRISQQYGIKLKSLYKRNGVPFGSEIQQGERIKLKGIAQYPPKLRSANPTIKKKALELVGKEKEADKTSNTPELKDDSTKPEPTEELYHTVIQGETLYSISRIYGVSVQSIKEYNDLLTNDIKVGSRIRIK